MRTNKIILILWMLLFALSSYGQIINIDSLTSYSYKWTAESTTYYEKILLYPNGYFIYEQNGRPMIINDKIKGKYEIVDSLLILNSLYKPDKIIVSESYDRNKRGMTFYVGDKIGSGLLYYNFYGIIDNGDTIIFRDQCEKTFTQKKIMSFWIMAEHGLKSPQVEIISNIANIINVKFTTQRIFDNEEWIIIDENRIQPIGRGGDLHNYYLVKGGISVKTSMYNDMVNIEYGTD